MVVLLTILHILVCTLLILTVLLQTGKRADLAGAFGGGGSQTAFGARGAATFLSKATTIGAVVFMVTSLALAIISSRSHSTGGASVLDAVPAPVQNSPAPAPQAPPAQTPPGGSAPAPTQEPGASTPTSPQ
jgi:preprotein translocase subunit SecG